ncbi:phosphoheptose isomerase [Sphingomonas sp.]|jgi:mannose-6-phosphate isomerase|uniref:phosphoheptose isomerase n=1 Tax=Sphingomonas sp. TaxID=28214 RepID=UPI002D7EF1E1|nr:phosphoheptose isomerase [Sphingomonas sp.]HEU0045944.1 phosphoheptose isomerase [Sphingomonas sp.]
MPATLLQTHRVEKPWGRHDLWPGFADAAPADQPVGEVWYKAPGDDTPDLLVKYLFTGEKLSIQVHPDDEQAHARGLPRGKDECWTILAAEPGATIALGTKGHPDKATLAQAARDGTIEALLDWRAVKAGDFLYCPSGTIHAIGGGLTLIEVQQNSETTYRLFDYGSDRELHLDDGMAVAKAEPYHPIAAPRPAGAGRQIKVEGPKFVLERWAGGEHQVVLEEGRTGWLVVIKGAGEVAGVAFGAGECVTVTGRETVRSGDDADLLFAYPGTQRMTV